MLYFKKANLKLFLKMSKRDLSWVAAEYNVRPTYISQIVNNKTNISGNFVGFLLWLTKMQFDDLFFYDHKDEPRRFFYGEDIWVKNQLMKNQEYKEHIRKKLQDKMSEQKYLTGSEK